MIVQIHGVGNDVVHAPIHLRDCPYYANFMNAVLEKIHAVGTYTWVNFTSLPQNVLQASHSLNWHRKDSHTVVVSNQFVKTVFNLEILYDLKLVRKSIQNSWVSWSDNQLIPRMTSENSFPLVTWFGSNAWTEGGAELMRQTRSLSRAGQQETKWKASLMGSPQSLHVRERCKLVKRSPKACILWLQANTMRSICTLYSIWLQANTVRCIILCTV